VKSADADRPAVDALKTRFIELRGDFARVDVTMATKGETDQHNTDGDDREQDFQSIHTRPPDSAITRRPPTNGRSAASVAHSLSTALAKTLKASLMVNCRFTISVSALSVARGARPYPPDQEASRPSSCA
jgi:hypothetical protein